MAIDKAKGIICKPMPQNWHDKHAINKIQNKATRELYRSIIADKKPYFMRYIYPQLMKQYNTYIKNANKKALIEFGMTISELMSLERTELTNEQAEFLKYYEHYMPVGLSNCVMNRICCRFEQAFDGYIGKRASCSEFDYTILKSDTEYTKKQYDAIKRLYTRYNKRLSDYCVCSNYERVSDSDASVTMLIMNNEFREACDKICPNRSALCNIVLDICYSKSSTKRFAWNMCGKEIILNLLRNKQGIISYPTLCASGDLEYGGDKFIVESNRLEVFDDYSL